MAYLALDMKCDSGFIFDVHELSKNHQIVKLIHILIFVDSCKLFVKNCMTVSGTFKSPESMYLIFMWLWIKFKGTRKHRRCWYWKHMIFWETRKVYVFAFWLHSIFCRKNSVHMLYLFLNFMFSKQINLCIFVIPILFNQNS